MYPVFLDIYCTYLPPLSTQQPPQIETPNYLLRISTTVLAVALVGTASYFGYESYKKTKTKSGYDVDIKVNNNRDVIDLVFHISKTGSTSVMAASINRQAITYTGEILVPQPKE